MLNRFATISTLVAVFMLTVMAPALERPAAAAEPLQQAEAVPAEITEVVTGGGWIEGKSEGGYRAILVMTGGGQDFAMQVFLQWVSLQPDGTAPQVVKTVPIKEANANKLPNAFLSIEAEKDNEAVLTIASYDQAAKKESEIVVKAGLPGQYTVQK